MTEPVRLLVNADPPLELAEELARLLDCPLEEAWIARLARPPRPTQLPLL